MKRQGVVFISQNQDKAFFYRISGLAALSAGLLFRRNLGAEISLFTGFEAVPQSVVDWFLLLQHNPFLGLSFLGIFDLVNYLFVGLTFLALAVALWPEQRTISLIAVTSGFLGIAVAMTSNISLTMFALSKQYTTATCEIQRLAPLAAGESLLVLPLADYPGTGTYMGLLLIALAGLLFSLVMRKNCHFNRPIAVIGIMASSFDLTYCLTFALVPFLQMYLIAIAGLFWMIWHLIIARKLFQLARSLGTS